jgi:hypothetical protein
MNDNTPLGRSANDNGAGGPSAVPVTPLCGLPSLEALGRVLAGVDLSGTSSDKSLLLFAARGSGGGVWHHGRKRTVIEMGTLAAGNPFSTEYGCIGFDQDSKPTEKMAPLSRPRPLLSDMPIVPGVDKWLEQWSIDLKLLSGPDAGLEVRYKASTFGGIDCIKGLIVAVKIRLADLQMRGGKEDTIVPEVELARDEYRHPQHGIIAIPLLKVKGWRRMDGTGGSDNDNDNGPRPGGKDAPAAPVEPPKRRARVVG